MRYLLYFPNPKTMTEQDGKRIDTLMKRLANRFPVESQETKFRNQKIEYTLKKYKLYLSDEDQAKDIAAKQKEVMLEATWKERVSLKKCIFLYGENGTVTEYEQHIQDMKQKEKEEILKSRNIYNFSLNQAA